MYVCINLEYVCDLLSLTCVLIAANVKSRQCRMADWHDVDGSVDDVDNDGNDEQTRRHVSTTSQSQMEGKCSATKQ